MAMIRKYGDLPAIFVPDEGEVVRASRSPAGPYVRAAVTSVRRRLDHIRVDFVWLDDAPLTPTGRKVVKGTKGHAEIREDDPVPLIRRLPAA